MLREALNTVMTAENDAEARLNAAAREARRLLGDAQLESQGLLETARAQGETEAAALLEAAEVEAEAAARQIAVRTAAEGEALRRLAEGRMARAVAQAVERIVSL